LDEFFAKPNLTHETPIVCLGPPLKHQNHRITQYDMIFMQLGLPVGGHLALSDFHSDNPSELSRMISLYISSWYYYYDYY